MTNDNHGESQARAQYESIVQMVAALNCDYDRLQELHEERENLVYDYSEAHEDPNKDHRDAERALAAWDDDNTEELQTLERDAGENTDRDDALTNIMESPLEISIRSGWVGGTPDMRPEEFKILLCTGGPAVRIMGELDEHGEPCRAWLEYQDWGTPWTQYFGASQDTLLAFASCFYFGG